MSVRTVFSFGPRINGTGHLTNSFICPGIGAMTEWRDIVQIVVDHFKLVKAGSANGTVAAT